MTVLGFRTRRAIPLYDVDAAEFDPRWTKTPIGWVIPRPDTDGVGAWVWSARGRDFRFEVRRGASEVLAAGGSMTAWEALRTATAAYRAAISESPAAGPCAPALVG